MAVPGKRCEKYFASSLIPMRPLSLIKILSIALLVSACAPTLPESQDPPMSVASSSSADISSHTSSSLFTARHEFDCDTLVPPATTTTEERDWGDMTIRLPFNPLWKDEAGESLMISEKSSGGINFGPYHYDADWSSVGLHHWKDTWCEPRRDFYYVLYPGTREEVVQNEKKNYPDLASKISIQHIGSVDAVVVPAPDAVCPSPSVIVLGENGTNYDFAVSCVALRHLKNPLQELKNIVKTIKLTK